ncbi:hypothetical protein [Oleisolibacter albus]|uniref:hypothetical protein n=1 Tax=Oleisolibacter albus TaxID=2171757 RepID=UPI0012D81449|nr:hypothetical protein [Oleisolibacter albus]
MAESPGVFRWRSLPDPDQARQGAARGPDRRPGDVTPDHGVSATLKTGNPSQGSWKVVSKAGTGGFQEHQRLLSVLKYRLTCIAQYAVAFFPENYPAFKIQFCFRIEILCRQPSACFGPTRLGQRWKNRENPRIPTIPGIYGLAFQSQFAHM